MNPAAPAFQRIFKNPFAFAGFSSTEPHLESYMRLDMPGALAAAGFGPALTAENTPRHKTVVAVKP